LNFFLKKKKKKLEEEKKEKILWHSFHLIGDKQMQSHKRVWINVPFDLGQLPYPLNLVKILKTKKKKNEKWKMK